MRFLLGPAGIIVSDRIGLDLPDWATAEDSKYLVGGIAPVDVADNLSFDDFIDEKLQGAVESKIENWIPGKASALITNAKLQRAGIELSNLVFQWECYPTYYGSRTIFIPSQDALSSMAVSESEWNGTKSFLQALSYYAQANISTKFIVYLVAERSCTPAANPSFSLTSSVSSN